MITPLDAGVVVAGLLLAFVGAAVSVYAVSLTGLLIGAGAGYLAVPALSGLVTADGLVVPAAAVAVGGALGGFLAYTGLSVAVLAIGGVVRVSTTPTSAPTIAPPYRSLSSASIAEAYA